MFVPETRAQSIPSKGTPGTFEVASWNVEFFGAIGGPSDDDRQIANVRDVILASDVDLWAFQEIADEADFANLVASLGSQYEGLIAPTSSQQGLGLAYIYRTDVVRLRSAREILTQFSSDFAGRPPYQVEAEIVLPDTTVVITLINIHMKAQSDQDSYDKRAAASVRLKNNIDFTLLASRPVIILGDYNDLLLNSITFRQPSPYKNFVDDIGNYGTPTVQMQIDERSTFCGSSPSCDGSTIDHIIVTNEVKPWYVQGSADHYDELLTAVSDYVFTTSDHLPVLAVFDVAQGVGVEDPVAPHPSREISVTAYPNPWQDDLTAEITSDRPGHIVVRLFDLVGRKVFSQSFHVPAAGTHRLELALPRLPAGLYVLSSTGQLGQTSQLVVHI